MADQSDYCFPSIREVTSAVQRYMKNTGKEPNTCLVGDALYENYIDELNLLRDTMGFVPAHRSLYISLNRFMVDVTIKVMPEKAIPLILKFPSTPNRAIGCIVGGDRQSFESMMSFYSGV